MEKSNTPSLDLPCLSHHLCQILPWLTETLFNKILIMFFIAFPIFLPHWTTHHNRDWIYQTICQAKPIKFIIKLYADFNTLAESLRGASLSKLDNRVNKNSIFNTKYAEFSTKWSVLLHFQNPNCEYNQPYNLHQKCVPLLLSILIF